MGEVVQLAKGLDPPPPPHPPTLIHIDMRDPERAGALCKKGWATHLGRELQLTLPNLRALCLIHSLKTVDSLLAVMTTHGAGKTKSGLCTVYPTTNLIPCAPPPPHMDMIALNVYFPAGEPQRDCSNLPFRWHTTASEWCDDLGIFPSHLEMPPLHHIPDISLPTLH